MLKNIACFLAYTTQPNVVRTTHWLSRRKQREVTQIIRTAQNLESRTPTISKIINSNIVQERANVMLKTNNTTQ